MKDIGICNTCTLKGDWNRSKRLEHWIKGSSFKSTNFTWWIV